MTTRKAQPTQNALPLSIDYWVDSDPVKVAWFDHALFGPLVVSAISVLFVGCSAFILPLMGNGKNGDSDVAHGSATVTSRNQTPLAREYTKRHENSSTAVPDLITEMLEKEEIDSSFFRDQLNQRGCSDGEILRRLSDRLKQTREAKQFERIVVVLDRLKSDVRELPEMSELVPRGLAVAGQHLQVAQLGAMHESVPRFLIETAKLPESAGLLGKLALIDDQLNRNTLYKLSDFESEEAARLAVKIVQQNNGDPSRLSRMIKYEAVCEFLWKGKLTGQKEFEGLSTGYGEASLKSFSQVISSMIDEGGPESVVVPVMSMDRARYMRYITRDLISSESIRKMDAIIASKVDKYLSDIVEGESRSMAEQRERQTAPGPFAFLYLAKLLGGRETAMEIARMVEENPSVPEKFEPIGDALIAINEPGSYDALVEVWTIHNFDGKDKLTALRENVGSAIEANFLKQLTIEMEKSKKDTRRMTPMIRAIAEVGTANSLPLLNQLNNIRSGRVNSKARDAIYEIRKREKAENK